MKRRPLRYGYDPYYVYQLWADDRCQYVGVTVALPHRLQEHSRKAWWSLVTRVSAEMVRGRYPALDRELALIRGLRPAQNIQGNPGVEMSEFRNTVRVLNSTNPPKPVFSLVSDLENRVSDGT